MATLSSSRPEPVRADDEGGDDLELERETADVTFWHQRTPGSTYVRCLLPARYLNGQCIRLEKTDLAWDQEHDHVVLPRQKGVSVWQFLGDADRPRIAYALQDLGVRVLMEVDDNYTTPVPEIPGRARPWNRRISDTYKIGNTSYSIERHMQVIPEMDGMIVATPYLRKAYLEHHDEVYLCPNTVDPDDWRDLEEKPTDVFRIVYSGSPSHFRDAPLLTKALKWAARQPGVEVWTQGFDCAWTFTNHTRWTKKLTEYRRSLGAFHVGLAPLRPGPFADGKSDLKALEYTMAGVLPIVSRTESYRPWFGFEHQTVEPDERAWVDAVKWIVKNRDAVPELLARSSSYVLNERTTAANAWLWRKALGCAIQVAR